MRFFLNNQCLLDDSLLSTWHALKVSCFSTIANTMLHAQIWRSRSVQWRDPPSRRPESCVLHNHVGMVDEVDVDSQRTSDSPFVANTRLAHTQMLFGCCSSPNEPKLGDQQPFRADTLPGPVCRMSGFSTISFDLGLTFAQKNWSTFLKQYANIRSYRSTRLGHIYQESSVLLTSAVARSSQAYRRGCSRSHRSESTTLVLRRRGGL